MSEEGAVGWLDDDLGLKTGHFVQGGGGHYLFETVSGWRGYTMFHYMQGCHLTAKIPDRGLQLS